MAFEELLERAGGLGLFQALQVLTLALPALLVPPHMLLENFSAAVPGHRCWAQALDNRSHVPANLTPEALLAVAIPPGPDRQPHQCRRFRQPQWQLLDPNATAANWSEAATEPCVDGWVYDRSTFAATIVAEWDLVCDSEGLKPLGQSIFMAGILVGAAAFGLLSSRLGRKSMLTWGCLQVAASGTATIFAPNFPVYCALRFLSAFGLAGLILALMTLPVEWTTTRRRAVTMTILGCTFSTGQMALGGLALALRDWRALQLALSVPLFAAALTSWWLPESARWLIITGKPDRALRELTKVARINGHKEARKTLTMESSSTNPNSATHTPSTLLSSNQEQLLQLVKLVLLSNMEEVASAKAHRSVLDLFRVPELRRRTWTLMAVNFTLTVSYYGLVLDLQSLGSDIFLLQILFGAVDFLGRAATAFFLRLLGRRLTLAASHALAGSSILANALLPRDWPTLRVALAVLGKGCFATDLTCLSLYKNELFPTSLRMTADGLQQSVSRLGAMLGPLVRMARQALPLLPPLSYGLVPIISSLGVLLFLPETQGLPLPDTIQDLEGQRSAKARGSRREVAVMESTWL